MTTADGVSPGTSAGTVLTSLIVFTLLYGGLAVINLKLMLRYIRNGPDPLPVEHHGEGDDEGTGDGGSGGDKPEPALAFSY
jgi:cytochrome bd ubiquinol oxidase subunit I